jgi:hypothetical protein
MDPVRVYLEYRTIKNNKKTVDIIPESKPIIPGNRPLADNLNPVTKPNDKPADTIQQDTQTKNKELERAGQFELKEIKTERTISQKPSTPNIIPINKPNQQKNDDVPSDGMGRLNMNDFF